MSIFSISGLGFASTGVSKGGLQFQQFFDLSLCYRDMATLSFMLTAADTYLYPVLVSKGGSDFNGFLIRAFLTELWPL